MTVIEYVCEEVTRQNHDITKPDGIERVGWMIDAWIYAIEAGPEKPTYDQAIRLGQLIERRKNVVGLRKNAVRVGYDQMPPPIEVPMRLDRLFSVLKTHEIPPLDFYRMFEEIHPFVDGNGRTGKILLNWLNQTLLADPIFPPQDFWGEPIRNP